MRRPSSARVVVTPAARSPRSVGWALRALVAVGALAGALGWAAPSAHAEGRNFTGQMAPEIYVQQGLFGLPTGATLNSLRGKPVVLKFFFTRCGACRDTLPEIERQHRIYGRRVQFIAVAFDNRMAVEAMWRRSGFSMPVAIDEHGVTPQRYGVVTYPTAYLIGADGIVRSYEVITDGMLEREAQRAIAMYGSGPAVTAPATPTGTSSAAGGSGGPAGAGSAAPVAPAFGPTARVGLPVGAALAPPVDAGDRNVAELGVVPAVLAGVVELARRNDYGGVLRIVERHFDASVHPAEVISAAHRIENIAIQRSERRKQRIQDQWSSDQSGAYESLLGMVRDFGSTSLERSLKEWSERVRADLLSRGQLAGR